jgi:hypothetical protein
MDMRPRVSVVTPLFNEEAGIPRPDMDHPRAEGEQLPLNPIQVPSLSVYDVRLF